MNVGGILVIVLVLLALAGIPIGFALGIATLLALHIGGMPLIVLPQKMFTGIDSVPLLAIPFFILAGNLMAGSINTKILDFSNALIGWVKGSLGAITVIASSIFAAISGSGVATVSAIGGITIPAMKKEGYPTDFAAAIASMASILGPLIPPSIFLIVYGSATETSIGDLFLAAAVPGVGLALIMLLYVLVVSYKRDFPRRERIGFKGIINNTLSGFWALFMPVFILGAIFLGIFTPTEASAVSAVYALAISLFVYRDKKLNDLIKIFSESALVAASVLFMLSASKVSSWVIVTSHLPQRILEIFLLISDSPTVILLLINILLLIVGMLMEGNCAIIMLTPLLLPLIKSFGISPLHFGVIMALNLSIGLSLRLLVHVFS